jgi:hypothetical protein
MAVTRKEVQGVVSAGGNGAGTLGHARAFTCEQVFLSWPYDYNATPYFCDL